jgi:hypothetical protein
MRYHPPYPIDPGKQARCINLIEASLLGQPAVEALDVAHRPSHLSFSRGIQAAEPPVVVLRRIRHDEAPRARPSSWEQASSAEMPRVSSMANGMLWMSADWADQPLARSQLAWGLMKQLSGLASSSSTQPISIGKEAELRPDASMSMNSTSKPRKISCMRSPD